MRLTFLTILFLASYSIFSQDSILGYFTTGIRTVEVVLINTSDSVIQIPNTIRLRYLEPNMVDRNDTLLLLNFRHIASHEKYYPSAITIYHGTIISHGILAFEKLNPRNRVHYTFIIPNSFRKKLRRLKIVEIILDYNFEETGVAGKYRLYLQRGVR